MAFLTLVPSNSMRFVENVQGSAVLEKLKSQQESGRFCDIVLHVHGKQFQAHRNVLAASSPYFDSVLKMHKIVKEELTISCQNHDAFQSLLNYMYSGSVIIHKDNVVDLLRLSNHFLVFKLKSYCSEYLDKHLDVSNCLLVKEMAEKYNMPSLLKTSVSFVQSHLDQVMEDDELLDYPLSRIETLLSDKKLNFPQETLLKFVTRWVGHDPGEREGDLRNLLTFVDWKGLDRHFIFGLLEADNLYLQHRRCLYFFLEMLEENSVPLDSKFKNVYEELKKHISEKAPNVDNDSFMNIAISTAIEELQPQKSSEEAEMMEIVEHQPLSSAMEETAMHTTDIQELKTVCPIKSELPTTESPCSVDSSAIQTTNGVCSSVMMADKFQWDKGHGQEGNNINCNYSNPSETRTKQCNSIKANSCGRRASNDALVHPELKMEAKETDDIDEEEEEEVEEEEDDEDIDDEDGSNSGISEQSFKTKPQTKQKLKLSNAQWKDGVKCPHCTYVGYCSLKLEHHMARAHAKDVTYKCAICEFTCKWNREYYMHMKDHFRGPPFHCDHCEYKCDRIQLLLLHRMKHTDEKPYKCDACDYRCRQKTNLVAHMRSHTGERPFKCEHCGRTFAIKCTLEQHLQSHRTDRPFLCDVCGFTTKYQSHLISHKRLHTGNVYHCQFTSCSYVSPKKSQLEAHTRTHTAVRSHICAVCGRAFIEKSHLVRHERIHLNEKPFKCDQCDYSSSRRDKLKEHHQKHHGENPTAKGPYKPRKTRCQTYDSSCYATPGDAQIGTMPHSQQIAVTYAPEEIYTMDSQDDSTKFLVVQLQTHDENVPVTTSHLQLHETVQDSQNSQTSQVMYIDHQLAHQVMQEHRLTPQSIVSSPQQPSANPSPAPSTPHHLPVSEGASMVGQPQNTQNADMSSLNVFMGLF